jgi:hypothetical protein
MKLNVTTIRRFALSALATTTMACALAACSATDDEGTESETSDVAALQEAENTRELGTAEQAVCRCDGHEGVIRCSTTGKTYIYWMCNTVSYNNARNACLRACGGGSCVTQPAQC